MRKTKYVTIEGDKETNRDVGKTFQITEMPASQAERWAFRVFQALARSGVDVPDHLAGSGMAGMAMMGLKTLANTPFHEAVDLLDEMFSCIKIVRDRSHPDMAFDMMEEDVEEVSTRAILRTEVFELHTGFSMAGVRQSLTSTPAIAPQD